MGNARSSRSITRAPIGAAATGRHLSARGLQVFGSVLIMKLITVPLEGNWPPNAPQALGMANMVEPSMRVMKPNLQLLREQTPICLPLRFASIT